MYPEEMYRGVPTKDDLTSSGGVAASLFQFNKENIREDVSKNIRCTLRRSLLIFCATYT